MKRLVYLLGIWLCWNAAAARATQPVVSSVTVRQDEEGGLVIGYDVTDAEGDTLWVSVEISNDVSSSMPSNSRIGRSMTSARLFPCLHKFLIMGLAKTVLGSTITVYHCSTVGVTGQIDDPASFRGRAIARASRKAGTE